jgi:hypothetical protein
MNERLLQFIWQHQYFNREELKTNTGEEVQILNAGTLNTNQGPDFSNARILINDIQLAGTVELHLRTSDWKLHGHSNDAHYKNVILHVVWEHDGPLNETVLELKGRVANSLLDRYSILMQQKEQVPCSAFISSVSELVWTSWKERLIAERIQQKSDHIQLLLEKTKRHWEEVFWQLIARNFGLPQNSEAFEAIAQSLPVTLLAKHKNQIHQLEALLLGQAGLLESSFLDPYAIMLQKEYQYLKKKHQLKPIHFPMQFLRMRPSNFPSLRLAQLAMLIHQSSHLLSKVLEAGSITEIRNMLNVTANDFWHTHYTLQESSTYKQKKLGEVMVNNLLINSIIPLLFVYAAEQEAPIVQQKALDWLRQIPKERNRITRIWEGAGVNHANALDSQALLYLKKQYCDVKRCLECAAGNSILKRNNT